MNRLDAEHHALLQRLERLEHENRRIWLFGVFALLVVVVGVVGAFAHPQRQTVRAQEFILVDGMGKTRALLGSDTAGAHFNLYDENGVNRLAMTANPQAPSIVLYGSDNRARYMVFGWDDGAEFMLLDRSRTQRVSLDLRAGGGFAPRLIFRDAIGVNRIVLASGANGPMLVLNDKDQKATAAITVLDSQSGVPRPSLMLQDVSERVLYSRP